MGITKHGFHFLLMNRISQVRVFLLHYFDYLKVSYSWAIFRRIQFQETKKNMVAALQFVFQLSFLTPEKASCSIYLILSPMLIFIYSESHGGSDFAT